VRVPADTREFLAYALAQLPRPPARVLEVGCGDEGGLARDLADAGYDVLAIDPRAPEGPLYRRITLEALDDDGPFDAAVAGRVLHHVTPLGPALDKLAGLAPLLIVDEFAHDRIDDDAGEWYAGEYRALAVTGAPPDAPPDLAVWRGAHGGLHPYEVLRSELDARYEERDFGWRPYLYRWLRNPAAKAREQDMIERGAFRPIGFRYTGSTRTETT
jgi:hypothetical protein